MSLAGYQNFPGQCLWVCHVNVHLLEKAVPAEGEEEPVALVRLREGRCQPREHIAGC